MRALPIVWKRTRTGRFSQPASRRRRRRRRRRAHKRDRCTELVRHPIQTHDGKGEAAAAAAAAAEEEEEEEEEEWQQGMLTPYGCVRI